MMQLANLSKSFWRNGCEQVIVKNANLMLAKGQCLALLGRNGTGKSTVLSMIAGSLLPDRGQVNVQGRISWPVGFSGSFHGALSGAQNTRFVARVHGVDTESLVDYVQDFAELGEKFYAPVRTYSSGMKARLAFATSMGIPFDIYMIDEVTSVGDATFRQKSNAVIRDRLSRSGAIIVSHNMKMVRSLCSCGAVLENGKLIYFPNISDAIQAHENNLKAADYA